MKKISAILGIIMILTCLATSSLFFGWRLFYTSFPASSLAEWFTINQFWLVVFIVLSIQFTSTLVFQIHLLPLWLGRLSRKRKSRVPISNDNLLLQRVAICIFCYNEVASMRYDAVIAALEQEVVPSIVILSDDGWVKNKVISRQFISLILADQRFKVTKKSKNQDKTCYFTRKDGVKVRFVFFSRAIPGQKNQHAKAGSMNAVYQYLKTVLVVDQMLVMDVDHILEPTALSQLLRKAGAKIALVQAAQHFHNVKYHFWDVLNNNDSFFSRVIMPARSQVGGSFSVGTGALWSSAYLLRAEQVFSEAFATYAITEDFASSLWALMLGYRIVWYSGIIAQGEAIVDSLSARLGQLSRWAEGTFQVFFHYISGADQRAVRRSGCKVQTTFWQKLATWQTFLSYLGVIPKVILMLLPLIYLVGGEYLAPFYVVNPRDLLQYWGIQFLLNELLIGGLVLLSGQGNWTQLVVSRLWSFCDFQMVISAFLKVISGADEGFKVTQKGASSETKANWGICRLHILYALVGLPALTFRWSQEQSLALAVCSFWFVFISCFLCWWTLLAVYPQLLQEKRNTQKS